MLTLLGVQCSDGVDGKDGVDISFTDNVQKPDDDDDGVIAFDDDGVVVVVEVAKEGWKDILSSKSFNNTLDAASMLPKHRHKHHTTHRHKHYTAQT